MQICHRVATSTSVCVGCMHIYALLTALRSVEIFLVDLFRDLILFLSLRIVFHHHFRLVRPTTKRCVLVTFKDNKPSLRGIDELLNPQIPKISSIRRLASKS